MSRPQKKAKKMQQGTLTDFMKASKVTACDTQGFVPGISKDEEKFKLFVDLDGVLADFDGGVKSIFNGQSPEEIPVGVMWAGIGNQDAFYESLSWTSDGEELWNAIKRLTPPPNILTGVPRTRKHREEKFNWCKRELSEEGKLICNHVDMAGKGRHELMSGRSKDNAINVITCWSKFKHFESKRNHILIDDRLKLKEDWEKKGGIFIHHTSAAASLQMLKEQGVIE